MPLNLLLNPSFNGIWTRKTHTGQEYGEIYVPEHWTAFWLEGQKIPWDLDNAQGYRRPEMHVINNIAPFLDPPRVQTPPKSLKLFTFIGIHEAGVYQRVTGLQPGKKLRAVFSVHGWSSMGDDPKESDFVDGGPYNMMFTIGIDPTGGTDPWSFSVVWGEPKGVYNIFEDVSVEDVQMINSSTAVTVFVRSQVRWRLKHNDAYMDDVRLEYIDDPDTPPDPDPPTPLPIPNFPVIKKGSKLGLHSILPAQSPNFVINALLGGTHVATVKAVSDLGWLKQIKEIDSSVITVGRYIGLPGGVDEECPPLTGDLQFTAKKIWDVVWAKFKPHIAYADYLEITNELDPVGPAGHALFAKLWIEIMKLVDATSVEIGHKIKLAILSYSMGVPEWNEWEAIYATGVFQYAASHGHILALHEYATPINRWWEQGIPGRLATPNHGPLMCRYRWLYEDLLIPNGVVIPLIITEANVEDMKDMSQLEWITSMAWYDSRLREDWYVIGANIFTLDGTNSWPQFNFGKFIPGLTQYIISIKDQPNALPPTAPEPNKYERIVRMADPTYMSPAQLTEAYNLGRELLQTVTPSWNDAVPKKEKRPIEWLTNTVHAGPVPTDQHSKYTKWVADRDPGTTLHFSNLSYFNQRDPAWATIPLGYSQVTMGSSGCLVTAVAEWMRKMIDSKMNPHRLVTWLNANNGFTDTGSLFFDKPTEMPGLPKQFKFDDLIQGKEYATFQRVKDLMSSTAAPVIIQVDFEGDSDLDSHFVTVLSVQENDLLVADPWTGNEELLMDRYPRGTVDESIFAIVQYSLVEDEEPTQEVPLLGFNDPNNEGAYEFLKGVKGKSLVVIPVFLQGQTTPTPLHFDNPNIRVIVNIRYSWSVDMGGGGTLPYSSVLINKFVTAVVSLIISSTGVWGWTISNEANNPRESPDGVNLRADDVVTIYNEIYRKVRAIQNETNKARMAPGALDPFNAQLGDVADWVQFIYENIDGLDFLAMHGYIRGPDSSLVLSKDKFQDDPLKWQSLNYAGCVLDMFQFMPVRYRSLPVYITEFNHIWKTTEAEGKYGWVEDQRASEVIAAGYGVALAHKFAGLAIYRWIGDDWAVYDNNPVLNTVRNLIEETYNA